jgi:hypothetical protein
MRQAEAPHTFGQRSSNRGGLYSRASDGGEHKLWVNRLQRLKTMQQGPMRHQQPCVYVVVAGAKASAKRSSLKWL